MMIDIVVETGYTVLVEHMMIDIVVVKLVNHHRYVIKYTPGGPM